ncbi:hypothetical protein L6164_034969 [Bauhinia variegata]|uniref:Uncharacterized protein n=1 Tax=Bauhinia variegata TaxID=167791 RepID=A0ACB9KWU2_BAUVA|nr:hypothetical protein L6164_034969 [Bauhinia variegata]
MSMAVTLPIPSTPSSLFASIDMGTNSFKLLIVHADPSGRFFPVHSKKEPVVLGRDTATTPYSISSESMLRALQALLKFKSILNTHNINLCQTRCVATAAVREALNREEFVDSILEKIGFQVYVLSGEEEARLAYLGVLHFLPIYHKLALTVDIGGGSTEFVIGKEGKVVFGTSLKLGHVTLTQKFPNVDTIPQMREHIRSVILESGLVEKSKHHGFERAVGSSGTIRAIEEALFRGFVLDMVDGAVLSGNSKRDWSFTRGDLSSVVEGFCGGGKKEKDRRDGFFKRRSEFIVAGALLLDEIFDLLGVDEMQVSGYSLSEGVIADTLSKVHPCYDLNAIARWHSVMRLALRFNSKNKMRAGAQCAVIAKDIFEALRKSKEFDRIEDKLSPLLNEKDLEYLEAASLLHSIGLVNGKKDYHKQSYHIIMNGDHLSGYNAEEVKLIALLARHHRKKFPESDALTEISNQEKQRFRYLCAIIRISVALQQHESLNPRESSEVKDPCLPTIIQRITENKVPELRQETENFKAVFEL